MDYDLIIPEQGFDIKVITKTDSRKDFRVRVKAENSSYLPISDRYISLYMTSTSKVNDLTSWKRIDTVKGHNASALDMCYPMQTVYTNEEYVISLKDGEDVCIIAGITDNVLGGKVPDTAEEVAKNPAWGIARVTAA